MKMDFQYNVFRHKIGCAPVAGQYFNYDFIYTVNKKKMLHTKDACSVLASEYPEIHSRIS